MLYLASAFLGAEPVKGILVSVICCRLLSVPGCGGEKGWREVQCYCPDICGQLDSH